MDDIEPIDPELRALHEEPRAAAEPDAAAVGRVRGRLGRGLARGAAGGGRWSPPPWWRYAATGAAALALVLAGGLGAAALAGRGSGPGFSSTVVPPPQGGVESGSAASAAGAPGAAASPGAIDSRSSAPAVQGQLPALTTPVVGGSCSTTPTVQFQGRGLAVTGIAPVTASETVGTLSVTVQQTGVDAAAALAAVQAKIGAVRDALARAGVPAASVQVSYVRTFADTSGRQSSAYASLQATVTGSDTLAEATRAVLAVGGISAYSSSIPAAGQPTQEEVQRAVSGAAAQARDMAAATASAAGVRLGDVQSVVTQPPAGCYGPTGASRVVQVTMTYAIK